MHSSKRTIDDMMKISDGIDSHHYIKGRGFDSEGNYIPFEARSESARNRNELSNKITINYNKKIKFYFINIPRIRLVDRVLRLIFDLFLFKIYK